MAGLQQSWTCLVLQFQQRLDARLPDRHLHGQVEKPRVTVSHLTATQDLTHHLPRRRLPLDAQRLVFDIDAKTGREDFYCCLGEKEKKETLISQIIFISEGGWD